MRIRIVSGIQIDSRDPLSTRHAVAYSCGGMELLRSPEPDRIKVLIAEIPGLLAAVVRKTLSEEPGMEVVAQIGTADELANALRAPVDVVVTACERPGLSSPFRALLFGPAALPVVAIRFDGDRIDVFGRSTFCGGGLETLTNVIREAVAAGRPRLRGER
jgi:hypothetical protein